MTIGHIETFKQQNGDEILKVFTRPTNTFPDGSYFYTSAEDYDLLFKIGKSWGRKSAEQYYITGIKYVDSKQKRCYFHQEVALKILGHYVECVEHKNGVQFDNYRNNLVFDASANDNSRNSRGNERGRGYTIDYSRASPRYQISCTVNGKPVYGTFAHNEYDACINRLELEKKLFPYRYDFLKDRRDDYDILELERTGKISEDEAIYRHVMRYASDNAWYYYRYGLQEYFRDNKIPVPDFEIDEYGRMEHPVTADILCPFN